MSSGVPHLVMVHKDCVCECGTVFDTPPTECGLSTICPKCIGKLTDILGTRLVLPAAPVVEDYHGFCPS